MNQVILVIQEISEIMTDLVADHELLLETMRELPRELLSVAWMHFLVKNDIIVIREIKYTVSCHTKKTLRLKNEHGVNYTFSFYKNSVIAEGKENNLLLDVEGVLIIDMLNINNKFHNLSDVFHLTMKTVDLILNYRSEVDKSFKDYL